MTVTLTWDTGSDFTLGSNVNDGGFRVSLKQSTTHTNTGEAVFFVEVNKANETGTLDAEAAVNNFDGGRISYSQQPNSNVRKKFGTLTFDGGETAKLVVDAQGDDYNSVAIDGPNGLNLSTDGFEQKEFTVPVHFNNGDLTGDTKAFGDGLFRVTEVTVNGNTTSNTDIETSVETDTSDTIYNGTGTFTDTATISVTSTLSVDVTLESSDGFETPRLDEVRVEAEPVVQVYQNGNWEYKLVRVLSGNGNTVSVADVVVYQNGAWT